MNDKTIADLETIRVALASPTTSACDAADDAVASITAQLRVARQASALEDGQDSRELDSAPQD